MVGVRLVAAVSGWGAAGVVLHRVNGAAAQPLTASASNSSRTTNRTSAASSYNLKVIPELPIDPPVGLLC